MEKGNHPEYAGMTVNETLYVSGYMEAFDLAVAAGDAEKMNEILFSVGLGASAGPIIQSVLSQAGKNKVGNNP